MSTNFCVIYNDALVKSVGRLSVCRGVAVSGAHTLCVGIIAHHMGFQVCLGSGFDYPAQAPPGERGRGGQMRMGRICDGVRELLRCTTGRIGTTLASGRVRSGAAQHRVLRRNRAAERCCDAALDSAAQRRCCAAHHR